jgi:hypothetical protein
MYPSQNTKPIHLSGYLTQQIQRAKASVEKLDKGSFKHLTVDDVTQSLIEHYKLTPLKLEKVTARIEENHNFRSLQDMPQGESFSLSGRNERDLVRVSWPVTGSTSLLGLRDSSGIKLDNTRDSYIRDRYVYPVGIKNDPNAGANIKQRIENDTANHQAHLDRLNVAIEEFNKELAEVLPPLVEAKHDAVSKLDSLEDFLNS